MVIAKDIQCVYTCSICNMKEVVTEKKAQSKVPRIKLSKPKCYLDYLREEEKKHPNARVDYKNTRSLFKRKG